MLKNLSFIKEDRKKWIKRMEIQTNNDNDDDLNPFEVDMDEVLKEIPIQLTTFSEWVKQQDWVPIDDDDITTPSGG